LLDFGVQTEMLSVVGRITYSVKECFAISQGENPDNKITNPDLDVIIS
jgi:hypothetical protein